MAYLRRLMILPEFRRSTCLKSTFPCVRDGSSQAENKDFEFVGKNVMESQSSQTSNTSGFSKAFNKFANMVSQQQHLDGPEQSFSKMLRNSNFIQVSLKYMSKLT